MPRRNRNVNRSRYEVAETGDLYTFAAATADCPVHRQAHEEAEARYEEYGESFRRVQRRTLGLPSGSRRTGRAA
ncbi:hypothetical protein [Streptomyces sp. NPDC052693]|uniref:hypothetical protein n=1 Tax=Streptomyces sp. NPDC052693 TaxID=3155814 RepID=UPI00341D3A3D